MIVNLSKREARHFMLSHHRLNRFSYPADRAGLARLLADARCIQIDPLSPMGTSPDLAAAARCENYKVGDLFRLLLPGEAFEHFAKERCLLPPEAFPYYRDRAAETPWWRLHERAKRVPAKVLDTVLGDVRTHGPVTPGQITDHGAVTPIDWSGWKGTGKLTTMAMEILWTRCAVVVAGRDGARAKQYDIPERALPEVHDLPAGDFLRWGLVQRVEAAGLLNMLTGPHWSTINEARKSGLVDELIAEGQLQMVTIEDGKRRYLAPAGFRDRLRDQADDHMRILGPLDAFMWDRTLIEHIFGFEYLWEVYKPVTKRRWGWYVCPLLHRGELVGRLEARVRDQKLVVDRVWREAAHTPDRDALKLTLARHVRSLGLDGFRLPARFSAPAKGPS